MDDFFEGAPAPNGDKEDEKNTVNATMPAAKSKKKGKIWLAVSAVAIAVVFFLAGALTVWFTLDGEIRTLIKVKNTIDGQYYKEIDDDTFYGAIFEAINDELLDPYSCYMTADEYATASGELAGNRSGLGLVFSVRDAAGNAQMKIARVCGNSPAEEAGLTAGSYVVGFGKTQAEITESETFDEFSDFLENFEAGEEFYVRIRTGETGQNVALTKEEFVENYVFYRTKTAAYGFKGEDATELTERGEPLACLDGDTAYIRLVQFGGEAANAFGQVMELFQKEGKKNLVLDLRENGGGYLDIMQEIAGYFCKNTTEKRPVVAVADYGERKEEFKAKRNVYDEYFSEDSRICVLADSASASASECLLGCMIDYGATAYGDICLAERNGIAKTYGKGIMQTTYYLSLKMDALKLTTAEIRWPVSGTSIHGRGILPEDGTKTVAEGVTDEEEIAAAIAALF